MSKQPEWSRRMSFHLRMEERARRGKELALGMRCPVTDSGGARCTLDATPEHVHRHCMSDLPIS